MTKNIYVVISGMFGFVMLIIWPNKIRVAGIQLKQICGHWKVFIETNGQVLFSTLKESAKYYCCIYCQPFIQDHRGLLYNNKSTRHLGYVLSL